MKTCVRCGRQFHGLRCKPCANLAQSKRYAADKEKYLARSAEWRIANPDLVKAYTKKYTAQNVAKMKASKANYRAKKPDAERAYNKRWNAENARKKSAYNAEYRKANITRLKERDKKRRLENPEISRIHCRNRKARKLNIGGKLSCGIEAKLFSLQQGKCPCCRRSLGDDYHLDHIVPLAGGGANTDDNVQLLRAECNMSKHTKHPIDFMQSRGFLL
mgnify:CR=1 FL=1